MALKKLLLQYMKKKQKSTNLICTKEMSTSRRRERHRRKNSQSRSISRRDHDSDTSVSLSDTSSDDASSLSSSTFSLLDTDTTVSEANEARNYSRSKPQSGAINPRHTHYHYVEHYPSQNAYQHSHTNNNPHYINTSFSMERNVPSAHGTGTGIQSAAQHLTQQNRYPMSSRPISAPTSQKFDTFGNTSSTNATVGSDPFASSRYSVHYQRAPLAMDSNSNQIFDQSRRQSLTNPKNITSNGTSSELAGGSKGAFCVVEEFGDDEFGLTQHRT